MQIDGSAVSDMERTSLEIIKAFSQKLCRFVSTVTVKLGFIVGKQI